MTIVGAHGDDDNGADSGSVYAFQPGASVPIRRSTYSIAGQAVAVKVSGDPNPAGNGLFYIHSDHLGSTSILSYGYNLNGSPHPQAGQPVPGSDGRYLPFGGWRTQPTAGLTDRGFTGHKANNLGNNDIGLIYMNARYYVPGIGRFASADTVVPDPANPQSYNRYSYVRNAPLNFTDPTGHRECGDPYDPACYGEPVLPPSQSLPWDLTEVLANEMVYHVQSPEMREIQEANILSPKKKLQDFYDLNCTGCKYDMKQTIQEEKGAMIRLCSLTECGWFDYSTPGNIHFGYMAASADIPLNSSFLAGGVLETITFFQEGSHSGSWRYLGDNAEDAAGVQLGYTLYQAFGEELTVGRLQIGLGIFWDDLQRPNPLLIMPLLSIQEFTKDRNYQYYPGALEYHAQ